MDKREGKRPTRKPGTDKPTRKPPMQKRAAAPRKEAPVKAAPKSDDIRLNKYIANSGMCSRREADIYIQSGSVRVNGVPVTEMGYKVKPGDVVNFDGKDLSPEKKVYVLLNKPKNFSTSKDESADRSVQQLVRQAYNGLLTPVGKMDRNMTGLLLLTNDSDMVAKFAAPKQRSSKIYQVSLDKNLKFEDLEKLQAGPFIDEHKVFVEEASYIEKEPKTEVGLRLRTANVKIVRRVFEHLGYDVLRIDRVSFAGLTKKNLPRGNWRFLTEQEIINLKNA
ncbi:MULTISPECIES: pseudouridine synthase [unclassified Flavobacterium]|uniref:pseudouridine synthase n=1 Tax=unclassified Flavobacterium TaxID=196869 RepID=UPI001F13629D|nr:MULTISPECIES: S4 domain-containing protein [unclassified Flavobacterium]UMY65986.1 RNA-binding S4 domain-containing protein [Flavobacterium sp. HJ-32-4]